MAYTFKQHIDKWIDLTTGFYLKDLDAIPEDKLGDSPAGQARTPYDFTYEVIVVNHRVANDIAGAENPAWPFEDGWAVAPEEFKSKDAIKSALQASVDAIKSAYNDKTEEELTAMYLPTGKETETCIAAQVHFAAYHIGYHGAQLNYIQSLHNDLEVHWS